MFARRAAAAHPASPFRRPMPRRVPPPVPPLLALLLAAPLAAQAPGAATPRPPSDSVPRELVQALLPDSDGLRVGEPAGDLPRDLLPPDGVVLGSVETGSYSTTIVVVMQPEHEAIAAHETRARAAGWTPPSPAAMPSPYGDGPQRGFLPSAYRAEMRASMGVVVGPMGMGRGTTRATSAAPLCRGNAMLLATTTPWSGGRTLLRLQSMNAAQYSPCRPRMPEAMPQQLVRHVTVYDSIIPALRPPPRAQVRPAGGGGSSNDWENRVEIEGATTPPELLAHYAAEMAREGWTPVDDAATAASVAVQIWRKTDAAGREWQATLTFIGRGGARRTSGSLRLEHEGGR